MLRLLGFPFRKDKESIKDEQISIADNKSNSNDSRPVISSPNSPTSPSTIDSTSPGKTHARKWSRHVAFVSGEIIESTSTSTVDGPAVRLSVESTAISENKWMRKSLEGQGSSSSSRGSRLMNPNSISTSTTSSSHYLPEEDGNRIQEFGQLSRASNPSSISLSVPAPHNFSATSTTASFNEEAKGRRRHVNQSSNMDDRDPQVIYSHSTWTELVENDDLVRNLGSRERTRQEILTEVVRSEQR